jgi:hypothetical protein
MTHVKGGWRNKIKGHFTSPGAAIGWTVVAGMITVLGFVLTFLNVFHSSGSPRQASATATSAGGAEPAPTIVERGYVLRVSTFVDTNDEDKIDLDTACPGWGSMHPRIGPSRCGDLADIVLDENGVHTADGRPRFVVFPAGTPEDYQTCKNAFGAQPNQAVNQIGARDLGAGDQVCVQTDLAAIGAVHIDHVTRDGPGDLREIKISFTVWRSPN